MKDMRNNNQLFLKRLMNTFQRQSTHRIRTYLQIFHLADFLNRITIYNFWQTIFSHFLYIPYLIIERAKITILFVNSKIF